MTNDVDTAVVQEMLHQFKDVHHGHWTIIMPVVSGNLSYLQERNVLGFCAFEVLEVKGPPDKTVTGYAVGGYILPGTEPGGPEMGLRAGAPRMAW